MHLGVVTINNKAPSSGQTQKGVCLKDERTRACSPTALVWTKPVLLSAPLSVVCALSYEEGILLQSCFVVPLAQTWDDPSLQSERL